MYSLKGQNLVLNNWERVEVKVTATHVNLVVNCW